MLFQKLIGTANKVQLFFGAGASSSASQNSITFTGVDIGPVSSNRRVVVCVFIRIAATVTADPVVTVAGQSTSLIAVSGGTTNPSGRLHVYITDAAVTSGTTASVVVTAGGGQLSTRLFISTYALIKTGALVLGQSDASTSGTNPSTQTSSLSATQVGIFVASGSTSFDLTSLTLSGPVTTDYNNQISLSIMASGTLTGTGTCTATTVGTGSNARTILVTWS